MPRPDGAVDRDFAQTNLEGNHLPPFQGGFMGWIYPGVEAQVETPGLIASIPSGWCDGRCDGLHFWDTSGSFALATIIPSLRGA
ncbi:MAG: hypothetical protein JO170_23895 [Verrucomicrobia bacterium]|nr:hypothetical protein [Verrucomicrobiota bacterium]